MDKAYQVKQYVGCVVNSRGVAFSAFKTGEAERYLFRQLDPTRTFETLIEVSVAKADLADEVRKALARGCGLDFTHRKKTNGGRT